MLIDPAPHSSYKLSEALECHLCNYLIPLNVFRGSIDSVCNPLALQIDHVIPKFLGGSDSPENLKPAHAFCNDSKNKYEWSLVKRDFTRNRISVLLRLPLDEIWTVRSVNGVCIFEDCSRVARSGNFWQYCVRHARFMGEKVRYALCKVGDCDKQARAKGEGYCTKHAKSSGIIPTTSVCKVSSCTKAVQRKFGNDYCQSHAREAGLLEDLPVGLYDRSAHLRNHKEITSRGCYFCVEVEQKATYLTISEIDLGGRKPSPRKIADTYRICEKSSIHFYSELIGVHVFEECAWCSLIENLRNA